MVKKIESIGLRVAATIYFIQAIYSYFTLGEESYYLENLQIALLFVIIWTIEYRRISQK